MGEPHTDWPCVDIIATGTTAVAVRDGEPLPAGIPGYAEVDALSRQ